MLATNNERGIMPIVRLVTDGDPNAEVVSVSLDNPRIDVSKIRRALPKLQKDMREKWPNLNDVYLSHPRIKNPIDSNTLHSLWMPLHLAASFILGVAGKEIIKPPAQEVGEYLRRWVKKFTKPKPKRRTVRR